MNNPTSFKRFDNHMKIIRNILDAKVFTVHSAVGFDTKYLAYKSDNEGNKIFLCNDNNWRTI